MPRRDRSSAISAVTCVRENTKTRSKNSSIGVTRASSGTGSSRGCFSVAHDDSSEPIVAGEVFSRASSSACERSSSRPRADARSRSTPSSAGRIAASARSRIAVSSSSGARPSRSRARSVAPRIAAGRSRSPSSASAAAATSKQYAANDSSRSPGHVARRRPPNRRPARAASDRRPSRPRLASVNASHLDWPRPCTNGRFSWRRTSAPSCRPRLIGDPGEVQSARRDPDPVVDLDGSVERLAVEHLRARPAALSPTPARLDASDPGIGPRRHPASCSDRPPHPTRRSPPDGRPAGTPSSPGPAGVGPASRPRRPRSPAPVPTRRGPRRTDRA